MSKGRIWFNRICLFGSFFCFLVVTYILLSGGFQSKEDKVITSFPIKVIQEELITDSRTKWNRVSVY